MDAILRELSRPAVVAAIDARNADVVGRSAQLSEPVRASLCLLADLLFPAHMEGDLKKQIEGSHEQPPLPSTLNFENDFTAKVGRWIMKHGILEKIGRLLVIARAGKWKGSWQEAECDSVPMYGLRVLLQSLMQNQKLVGKVLALPGLAESLVYIVEQGATASPEAEASTATYILSHMHNVFGKLTEFCTRDEIMRCAKALRASTKHPPSEDMHQPAHAAREFLAARLEADIKGWPYPPPISLPKFWCDRLLKAPDTDEAERIVNNILGHTETLPPMANDKQLYELEFWPLLARVAVRAGPERRHLLITFSDAFNLYPEARGIPMEPGVKRFWVIDTQPFRSKVILQLLKAGIVKTLEPAAQVDDTAVHVMHFFVYISHDVKVASPMAKSILTDRDLMPFLLRFALLEYGCTMGVALAKLAVMALLSMTSAPPERKDDMPEDQFSLTIRSEETPGHTHHSLRFNYKDGSIYVGIAHEPRAAALAVNFMPNGLKLIQEYNEQHPDRPYLSRDLDQFKPSTGIIYERRPPTKRRQCALCEKSPAKSKCARCQKTFYCGKDCQSADWPIHKLACQKKT